MKQAIPYIRYSSFRQAEGDSYRRQLKLIDDWLAQHPEYTKSNLTFEDLAKSGYSTKSGKKASGFIKISEAIEAGLIRAGDCVLLEAIDRATRRGMVDALDLLKPILRAGVSIVTIDDGQEYTAESLNGSQIFLLVAKLQAAHNYSKQLSERVSESYKQRRKDAAEGKVVKRYAPLWLNSDGTVIEGIAQQIVQVFDLYVSGVGKHAIASRMRKSGVEKLAKCSGTTVQGWLTNPAVIGIWENKDSTGEAIRGVYPAIVEPETFYLVQRLLQERATKRERTSKHFLVGLVKCEECGASMVMHHVNKVPSAMRCLSHHRLKDAGCSNNKSIPVNVIKLVQVLTSNRAFKRALAKQTLSVSDKRRITLEAEIAQATQEIGKLVALSLAVELPEIQEKLLALKDKREALQAELEGLDIGDAAANEAVRVLKEESILHYQDSTVLNAMLRDTGYVIRVSQQGEITTTEGKQSWKYLGVKRKVKSNSTEAYRLLERPGNVLLINPDPTVDIPPVHLDEADSEVDIRYSRYGGLVIGQEGDEEEHLDPPYVQWERGE